MTVITTRRLAVIIIILEELHIPLHVPGLGGRRWQWQLWGPVPLAGSSQTSKHISRVACGKYHAAAKWWILLRGSRDGAKKQQIVWLVCNLLRPLIKIVVLLVPYGYIRIKIKIPKEMTVLG